MKQVFNRAKILISGRKISSIFRKIQPLFEELWRVLLTLTV